MCNNISPAHRISQTLISIKYNEQQTDKTYYSYSKTAPSGSLAVDFTVIHAIFHMGHLLGKTDGEKEHSFPLPPSPQRSNFSILTGFFPP